MSLVPSNNRHCASLNLVGTQVVNLFKVIPFMIWWWLSRRPWPVARFLESELTQMSRASAASRLFLSHRGSWESRALSTEQLETAILISTTLSVVTCQNVLSCNLSLKMLLVLSASVGECHCTLTSPDCCSSQLSCCSLQSSNGCILPTLVITFMTIPYLPPLSSQHIVQFAYLHSILCSAD